MYQPQRPMVGPPMPMFQQPQQQRMPMQVPPMPQGQPQQAQDPMAQLMSNPAILMALMQRKQQGQPFNPAQVRPQEQQVNAVNAGMGTSDPMAQGAAQSGGMGGGDGGFAAFLRSINPFSWGR